MRAIGNKRYPLGKKIGYWFDNLMAKGFFSKILVLLVATVVFVTVVGFLASIATGNFEQQAAAGYFTTFMYVLGKGGAPTGEPAAPGVGVAYVFFMILSILYCSLFTAILIGLVNQGIRGKVDELGTGQSDVLEDGHVLVLGFNDAAMVLIGEFIEAKRDSVGCNTVVILDELDRSEMTSRIRRRFGKPSSHPSTRLICRTGSIYGFDDLVRCSIKTCKSVVVCANTDFDTVKAIMACSHILNGSQADDDPYIVAVVHGRENIPESRLAGQGKGAPGRLELLSLNEVLARIMVHTSRQPGLSDVFTELFNYADDEFYIFDDDPSFPLLWGKSVAEINHYLQMSYAVGVRKVEEGILVGPPRQVLFERGDALIVVKENDSPLQTSEKPARKMGLSPRPYALADTVSVLVIGVQPIIDSIIAEYAHYLNDGSVLYVADVSAESALESVLSSDSSTLLRSRGINLVPIEADAGNDEMLYELLGTCDPDSVLVLADKAAPDSEGEDEKLIRTLLYLRDYRSRSSKWFSITSEMLLSRDKELAAATEPDDFIIGRQFAALLMAQVAENREMAALFNTLLSNEGFEVYMKPASRYVVLDVPVDLVSVSEAVADKDEVFIGLRRRVAGKDYAVDINPSKYVSDMTTLRQYTLGEDDYFVVLAEDGRL